MRSPYKMAMFVSPPVEIIESGCLGIVAARRQNLAGDKAPVLSDEYEIGKGAADIDAEATHKFSVHGFSVTRGSVPDASDRLGRPRMRSDFLGCPPD